MEFSDNIKKAVVYLTIIIGLTIALIAILTNVWFLKSLPPYPVLTIGNGRTAQMVIDDINNYKSFTAIIKENNALLNDLLVTKFLKGLFDSLIITIISYIFGKPLIAALSLRISGNKNKTE